MREHPFSKSLTRSKRNRREQRSRKYGVLDTNIDRQIWVIHAAIVEKLIADTALIEQVKDSIDQKMEEGHPRFKTLRSWRFILEGCRSHEQLREEILEDSDYKRKLRRATPFGGILTEEERVAALEKAAVGPTPE